METANIRFLLVFLTQHATQAMLKAFLPCPEFPQTIFGCKATLTKNSYILFSKIFFLKVAKSRYKNKSVGKEVIA